MSDDTNGHGPDSQHPDDTPATQGDSNPRRKPPAAGKGLQGPPTGIMQLRVALVARAMVDGMGRASIIQHVATNQTEEAADRARARANGTPEGAELNGVAPFVWGDNPISERTLDNYIAKAKALLAEEGRRVVTKHREFVVAITLARYTELFHKAVDAGRLAVARQCLKDISDLFGVRDAIKAMQIAEARAQSEESKPDNLSTDEGKASVMSSLVVLATEKDPGLRRVFAAFAALEATPAVSSEPTKQKTTDRTKPDTSNKKGKT